MNDMPAEQDIPPEDRAYAAQLLASAQQALAEVGTDEPTSVAPVVLHALIALFEDAASQ